MSAVDGGRMISDVLPPEGVPVRFVVAGLGARVGAQLTDLLISVLALVAFLVVAGYAGASWSAIGVFGALGFFAIRVPYYIATELLWNGQTLGKRMLKLRVIAADGRGLTAQSVVVRNLMKEFEVFVPGTALLTLPGLGLLDGTVLTLWILGLLLVPRMNRRRQRIGDIIAGTYVIRDPVAVLLPDIAVQQTERHGARSERFRFAAHHLDHYGRFELQTLERVLRSAEPSRQSHVAANRYRRNLIEIARKVVHKIQYPERVRDGEAEEFLRAFYAAQRAYLEQRRLFGESREDKFHGAETDRESRGGAADR